MSYASRNPESTQTIAFTLRERYILAQALVLGIEKLAEVEGAMREWSNIHDMGDLLRSPLFAPMAGAILAIEPHPNAAALFGAHFTGEGWVEGLENEPEDLPSFLR